MSNRLFLSNSYQVKPEFTNLLASSYHSAADLVNFGEAVQAAKAINDWVENNTEGKIKNLVSEGDINPLVKLVLVNAIYFKGQWAYKFNKEKTVKMPFHLADGSKHDVDMMVLLDKKFRLQINPAGLKAMVCEFPYENEDVSMTIILPHEGISIDEVESQLSANTLKEVFEVNSYAAKVHAYVPKFKLEYKNEVNNYFKDKWANYHL